MPNVMKKIKEQPFGLTFNAVSWAYKIDDTTWQCAYVPETCRTYLSDYWYGANKDREYFDDEGSVSLINKLKPLDTDSTNLFFAGKRLKVDQEIILDNLKKLNVLEEKHGIIPTKVIFTTKEEGVLFLGDPDWQSCLWKQTLFSFYCKSCLLEGFVNSEYSSDYYKLLKGKEDILFSKIKTEFEEIIKKVYWENIHVYSGVFTILEGTNNKPMTKLLLGDKFVDHDYEEVRSDYSW